MRFGTPTVTLLLLLCACEDELPHKGALGGQVVRLEDGVGYGPVPVALYDLETLRAVATTVTDEDGAFRIARLAPGFYTPVVYDEHRVVFHLERPRYEVRRGETAFARIPMADADLYSDTGVFLEGLVLDDADDSPIPLAIVEIADIQNAENDVFWSFSEVGGRGGPLTGVTDENGHYRIGPMPIISIFPSGDLVIPHVRIHHPLFIDAAIGPWDRFQIPTTRDVRLIRGEDSAVLRGTLRHLVVGDSILTEPAAGIAVAIEWQAMAGRFPKLLLSTVSSRSDANGDFEFKGLPPGRFLLLPAYLPDDGFVGERRRTADIPNAGDVVELASPLAVARAVRLLSPVDGALEPEVALFDWEDLPLATSYVLTLTRGEDLQSFAVGIDLESRFVVEEEARAFLEGGRTFHWRVEAYGDIGELSESERSFVLHR